ncbi:MAG: HEPN domain-containing protein [Actinomycetota bacterium]
MSCFLAQQAAQKSLKAYLCSWGTRYYGDTRWPNR